MLLSRINRAIPEKVFICVYNSYSTDSLSNGQAVQWDYATDANGTSVTKPAAGTKAGGKHMGFSFAGIVAETIAAGDWGLIQCFGYHSAIRARTTTGGASNSTPAVAAGVPLTLKSTVFCVESFAMAIETTSTATMYGTWHPCVLALGATSGFTTATIAGIIRAM